MGLPSFRLSFYQVFTAFNGAVVSLWPLRSEFILHFAGTGSRKLVRGVQIGVLVLPFVSLIHLTSGVPGFLSVATPQRFCSAGW